MTSTKIRYREEDVERMVVRVAHRKKLANQAQHQLRDAEIKYDEACKAYDESLKDLAEMEQLS